jgi:glycerate dehydrogenase
MPVPIVVLDAYALNPGDLSWDAFRALGTVEIHDRTGTDPALIAERARDAQVILTNKTPLAAGTLGRLPRLRYVGVLATGYNVVDVAAARAGGITVTNVPGYSTASVAQMVFAHVLEFCHNVRGHSDAVRRGEWTRAKDFSWWITPLAELAGKTMGIVGFGAIGRAVGAAANAFGMRVLAHTPHPREAPAWTGFRFTDLPSVFRESDVLSLHCTLTPETAGMVNAARLAQMKRSAFLVNASRGGLVVEQDLADALVRGVIAGAGLDVLGDEPPRADNPLLGAPNVTITPHIAWATREARERLLGVAVKNLAAFLEGAPVNVVP